MDTGKAASGPSPAEIEAALLQLKRELERPALAEALRTLPPEVKARRQPPTGTRTRPDHAGLREWHRARSTGTYVGIYDGIEAGLDTDGGRWSTICDDHGRIISHRTLALARLHAPCPEEWCEVCSGEEEPQS